MLSLKCNLYISAFNLQSKINLKEVNIWLNIRFVHALSLWLVSVSVARQMSTLEMLTEIGVVCLSPLTRRLLKGS